MQRPLGGGRAPPSTVVRVQNVQSTPVVAYRGRAEARSGPGLPQTARNGEAAAASGASAIPVDVTSLDSDESLPVAHLERAAPTEAGRDRGWHLGTCCTEGVDLRSVG
jgi:hypothetical protein